MEKSPITILLFQVGKLRLGERKPVSQSCIAGKWQCQSHLYMIHSKSCEHYALDTKERGEITESA